MSKATLRDYFYMAIFCGVSGMGMVPAMLFVKQYDLAFLMMSSGFIVAVLCFGLGVLGGRWMANNGEAVIANNDKSHLGT
jgi:hypothetical protein